MGVFFTGGRPHPRPPATPGSAPSHPAGPVWRSLPPVAATSSLAGGHPLQPLLAPHALVTRGCRRLSSAARFGRIAAISLAAVFLCAGGAPAQTEVGADPLTDAKRREILDQSDAAISPAFERYAVLVLLPAAAVLLCIILLRRGAGP